MSLTVNITVAGLDLSGIAHSLPDRSEINARIAGDTEKFLKDHGPEIAAGQHRTADSLGATPTGHLAEAYEGIEGISDGETATLLVPAASRLRAAFGSYVLTPGPGKKCLTMPANAAAYGRRAGEFDDLFILKMKASNRLVLARRVESNLAEESKLLLRVRPGQRRKARKSGAGIQVMFSLVPSATIPEDKTLIPFDQLEAKARNSAEACIDEIIERNLQP